ncbi:MAG: NAD(+) synthase [Chloroflexota bacterium]
MDTEELAERLVSWIKDQVATCGCRGVVLGMSGGIDSSVLAVLSERAQSRDMLGVIMPCHSNPQDEAHARAVASKFSVPTERVVLDSVYDALLKVLPGGDAGPGVVRLALANLKARLRMLTLYYFANRLGYLVAGSGNRSELAVGYFTKYGDSGVDILPLGNLLKRQVRELARFLGVPAEIIEKPPSAGLWEGQTDEAELGCSYEQLDRCLIGGAAPEEVKSKIECMMAAAAHKLKLPPLPDF